MARRAGISAAKGDYCMFLDADDAYEPECLATIRETIESTDADIVIFNNYSYFEEDQSIEYNKAVFPDWTKFFGETKLRIYEEMIKSERVNNICMKAIKTPLLQADDTRYELLADNPHGEDLLQSLYPLTHARKIVYRDRRLYRYRRHRSGMTRQMDAQRMKRLFDRRVYDQLRHYMSIWGLDAPQDLQRLYARTTRTSLNLFWLQYRSAHTAADKRAVLDFPWEAKFDVQTKQPFTNPYLSRMRRLQVRAILNKQMILLDCINMLGKLKMRASHGA
jgi:glycosyltransferase involved in cell wall biosynthesis